MSILQWILSTMMAIFLVACSGKTEDENQLNANTVRIGVIASGEQAFMKVAKEVAAKKYDLNIQLIPYLQISDLNKALENKEIDANIFQNHIYFQYSQRKYGYHLSEVGLAYLYPMGIYSQKIRNVLHLSKGAVVALPEEPTNEARALFLLETAGLIRMGSEESTATIRDIISNPKALQFLKFPAREVVKALPSVDAAVINISYVLPAGINPAKDALVIENKDSAYASVIVVRRGEERDFRLRALIEILRSIEVQKSVETLFHGQAVPAWK